MADCCAHWRRHQGPPRTSSTGWCPGEVLAQQIVGVLVGRLMPRRVRVGKEHLGSVS